MKSTRAGGNRNQHTNPKENWKISNQAKSHTCDCPCENCNRHQPRKHSKSPNAKLTTRREIIEQTNDGSKQMKNPTYWRPPPWLVAR